ncbi:helix-turn-helix domain-containing protein [Cyanobium sp. Alchichica 3B3-8F6]|uniref:helix-turn-helix domain-containing protein n=1 Tax=Cyanobium sp. Alchichica 3B3-8F6 TaxID=2823696 RepID=UPI0020CDD7F1|nr:helix-turn-helix domain-containing protein [Cyanobium sp. Alchichica 3B3-8F6]MCP9882496.1 helix-turn-helix domain-containing protein [Cyanobium sp. Alchichica 3B3-8F6]
MASDSSRHEPIAALQALGQALRQGREGQGLAIAELAQRLNMGQEQLQALEDGDADRLPEPVFVIAQARRVANTLAINVDAPLQTLRESGGFQPRPVKVAELAPRGEAPGAGRPSPVQAVGRLALAAGLVAALGAGGTAGWQQWQRLQASRPAEPEPANAPQITTPQASAPQTPSGSELLLSSSQPCWLEVKQQGGESLFRGTFEGERSFPLGSGLSVLAGRPDLVKAQLGNGPAKPLGRIDQVRWQQFKAPAP